MRGLAGSFLEVDGEELHLKLLLNGQMYSEGQRLSRWKPESDMHILSAINNGMESEKVSFQVRTDRKLRQSCFSEWRHVCTQKSISAFCAGEPFLEVE